MVRHFAGSSLNYCLFAVTSGLSICLGLTGHENIFGSLQKILKNETANPLLKIDLVGGDIFLLVKICEG